jgi:trk system potassium uptake protein TrkH
MLLVLTGIFVMLINYEGQFIDIAFQVISAFGTVGLSRGITGDLNCIGRGIIMTIMFVGRVGPLVIGFFLATRSVPKVKCPAEQIYLG